MASGGRPAQQAPAGAGPQLPEKRGYLLNQYTGSREHCVLRGGVLRVRQTHRGPDAGPVPHVQPHPLVYLAHGSSVKLVNRTLLQVTAKVPYNQDFLLAAPSEAEAEGWRLALETSIEMGRSKMEKLLEGLKSGCTMHKYNYSNSKRARRFFWVSDDGRSLCWGRAKGDEGEQSVNLCECIGIIYGPQTTTFQRCTKLEDPSWTCFSLLFMGRTVDLAVGGDQVHAWFLGVQHLVSVHGIGSMPVLSAAELVTRTVRYKLTAAAAAEGLGLGRFLAGRVSAAAAREGRGGLGRGALERGGRLKSGLTPAGSPTDSAGTSAWSEVKGSKASSRSQPKSVQAAELRARALQKQAALREELLHLSAARVLSARLGPWPRGSPPAEADRAKVLEAAMQEKALQTRSGQLESLVRTLAEEVENIAPQAKEAAKTEKVVRKLQAKLEDSEARRKALESESGPVKASDAASAGGGRGATAGEEARVRGAQLRERVEGLKRAVQEARARQQAERDAAQSQAWDAQLSRVRQEKLAAEQQIEALDKELAQLHEAEQRGKAALERARAKSGKLAREVEPLRKAVAKLKREQVRALEEVQKARPEFSAEARKFEEGFAKITARSKLLEEKYKVAMEERKRLHNLVLDLKGNIRVFVRVRPINPKEQAHEVPGEPTCDFKDDNQAGIFDEQKQSRKWYEFDQVFSPSSMQAQVFEEAKPLATSVLDGFNVCIFAYGQTGSGKTHTMAGPSSDPGLNTRVLRELFRIRDERKGEYDIKFSMSVTEIYNEIIRDLLAPSAKKLDVKLNADGSCSVPGLSAHDVSKLDDVLTCIDSAQKNRAVASTDMNSESSRSHSIVTVRTENTFKGDKTYVGKINLIDLAGSENTGKSGVSGQGMKEAQNINKSLSALGDVIQSLVARNPHTPYRNSKLTMMLKDSLGGNSKTLMIVCCSPAQYNVSETMSSLNFASRARNVELGKAKRNTA